MPTPLAHVFRSVIGIAPLLVVGSGMGPVAADSSDTASGGRKDQKPTASMAATVDRPLAASADKVVVAPPASDAPATNKETAPVPQQPPETELAAGTPSAREEHRTDGAPRPDPDTMLGMSPIEIMGKLGLPETWRDEPPAHVWRYEGDLCVLEVFFFLDINNDSRRVLSYDIQVEHDGRDDALRCYREIDQRHATALRSNDPR